MHSFSALVASSLNFCKNFFDLFHYGLRCIVAQHYARTVFVRVFVRSFVRNHKNSILHVCSLYWPRPGFCLYFRKCCSHLAVQNLIKGLLKHESSILLLF